MLCAAEYPQTPFKREGKPLPYGSVRENVTSPCRFHRRRSAKGDRAGDQRSPLRVCCARFPLWESLEDTAVHHGFRRKHGCFLPHSSLVKVLEGGLRGKLLSTQICRKRQITSLLRRLNTAVSGKPENSKALKAPPKTPFKNFRQGKMGQGTPAFSADTVVHYSIFKALPLGERADEERSVRKALSVSFADSSPIGGAYRKRDP